MAAPARRRTVTTMAGHYEVDAHDARTFDLSGLPPDMDSRHTHEWHRYIIHGPDFYGAARIAAKLGWWLHCWDWEEAPAYAITDKDPPIPWASWLHVAWKGQPPEQPQ